MIALPEKRQGNFFYSLFKSNIKKSVKVKMEKHKAVAYIRVSTKSESQIHSFEYQYEYWRAKISSSKEAEFAGIFADKGISGKSVNKRPQFLQMLSDARRKKFAVIYTKSVARFGRNVENCCRRSGN